MPACTGASVEHAAAGAPDGYAKPTVTTTLMTTRAAPQCIYSRINNIIDSPIGEFGSGSESGLIANAIYVGYNLRRWHLLSDQLMWLQKLSSFDTIYFMRGREDDCC